MYALYDKPDDRDPGRDYREGRLEAGGGPPEALVYFAEVLRYYLRFRPAARLLQPPEEGSPLEQLLIAHTGYKPPRDRNPASSVRQTTGVQDQLPVYADRLIERIDFPLAWENITGMSFRQWKRRTRRRVRQALLEAPSIADFRAVEIDSQDRDGYTVRKIELNLSAESRVLAYLAVPTGVGPYRAVLLLHDHGAEFRIGKEKVFRAWDIPESKQRLAQEWVDRYYGGRYLGDELAQRGYVCLAVDALNWSDRGGGGFDGQQALASNLMHLGMSLAGTIAHDDLRSVEFLAAQEQVDSQRVAAMGLSMGAYRTWQVAALTDRIAAGAAICWMSAVEELMTPGNNQTKGHSSYAMLHPGLLSQLDYPDIASLACPKPMLFYNGREDKLFPVTGVEAAYKKMRHVWESQQCGRRLETRLWDVPHEFNAEMQDAAFAWLDRQLGR